MTAEFESTRDFDSLARDRQLESLIDQFESAWGSANAISIEKVLSSCDDDSSPRLFRSLLDIELELRRAAGESPDVDEYVARFGEHETEIREAFADETDDASDDLCVRCPQCASECSATIESFDTPLTCNTCRHSFRLMPPDDSEGLAPGDRIAHFELEEHLGSGGFGSVWKANDPQLNRKVAIKVPRGGSMTSEEVEQFFQDARAAARLKHPGIVSVHEVGRHADSVYIVSELVDGLTLKNWMEDRRLHSRQSAELCLSIAEALEHAHSSGIIHRDLKPGNIMVDQMGQPYLIDFGLAINRDTETTITFDGRIVGTPSYMSPEQARGDGSNADARTDVYSLGVILFELLAGQRPFRGELQALISSVIRDEPPAPTSLRQGIPRDIETICLKCLEKQPSARYVSAADLADDLTRYLNGEPVRARPITRLHRGWRWCRRNPIVAALSGVLAVLLLVLAIGGPIIAFQQAELAASESEAHKKTKKARDEADGARRIADDQRREAEAAKVRESIARERAEHERVRAQRRVAHMQVGNSTRYLENGDVLTALVWAQSAMAIDAEATAKRSEVSDSGAGQQLDAEHRQRLAWLINDAPRLIHRWYRPSPEAIRERAPSLWVPDNKPIAIWHTVDFVKLLNLETGAESELPLIRPAQLSRVRGSGNGERLVTVERDKIVRVYDIDTGRQLIDALELSNTKNAFLSSDGSRLMVAGSRKLHFLDLPAEVSAVEQSLPQPEGISSKGRFPYGKFHFSQDAEFGVTLSRKDGGVNEVQIWNAKSAGSVGTPSLLNDVGLPGGISFSQAGDRLVTWHRGNTMAVIDSASGNILIERDVGVGPLRHCEFSSDGSQLVIAGDDGTVLIDAETGDFIGSPLPHGDAVFHARFSPSGNYVATASRDHTARVWDTRSGKPACPPIFHHDNVRVVQFVPGNESRILTCARDGSCQVWEWPSRNDLQLDALHTASVNAVQFCERGKKLISASDDETVRIRELTMPEQVARSIPHSSAIIKAVADDDGRALLTLDAESNVRLWDLTSSELGEPRFQKRTDATRQQSSILRFSKDGSLAVYTQRNRFNILDVESGTELHSNLVLNGSIHIRAASFSSSGDKLLVAGERNSRIWDARTGEIVRQIGDARSLKTHAVFTPDDQHVFVAGRQGDLRLFRVDTEKAPPVWTVVTSQVVSVDFSTDGAQLLTAHRDGSFQRRSVDTGKLIGVVGHHESITAARFLGDSMTVLTTGMDGKVRLWSRSQGELLATPMDQGLPITSLTVDEANYRFATGGTDGTVRLWTTPSPISGAVESMFDRTTQITGRQINESGEVSAAGPPNAH